MGLGVQIPGCVRVGTGASTLPPSVDRGGVPVDRRVGDNDGVASPRSSPTRQERDPEGATAGTTDAPSVLAERVERGSASWYGEAYHGKTTASGEPFDMYAMTAAHPTLEMNTRVEVENLENGRAVIVRINDRGPYSQGRVIDLSMAAAQALGFVAAGTAEVEIRLLR